MSKSRYYCDYCDVFLTHDSAGGRKTHNMGWKHRSNVRGYFAKIFDKSSVLRDYSNQYDRDRRGGGEADRSGSGGIGRRDHGSHGGGDRFGRQDFQHQQHRPMHFDTGRSDQRFGGFQHNGGGFGGGHHQQQQQQQQHQYPPQQHFQQQQGHHHQHSHGPQHGHGHQQHQQFSTQHQQPPPPYGYPPPPHQQQQQQQQPPMYGSSNANGPTWGQQQ